MSTSNHRSSLALLANLAALATASTVHGQTRVIHVDDDAPAGGDGTTWGTAFRYLDDALAVVRQPLADEVIEIHIAGGTYTPGRGTMSRDARFELTDVTSSSATTISLYGGFAGITNPMPGRRDITLYKTMLSADLGGNDEQGINSDNAYTLLIAAQYSALTIDGMTFSNTWGQNSAIQILYSSATLRDCIFEDHFVQGGLPFVRLYSQAPVPEILIEGCVFRRIRCDYGTSTINTLSGHITISGTSFELDPEWNRSPIVRNQTAKVAINDSEFLGALTVFEQEEFSPTSAPTLFDRCLFVVDAPFAAGSYSIKAKSARLRDSIMRNESSITSAVATPLIFVMPGPGYVSVEHCNIEGGVNAVIGDTGKLKWSNGNIEADPAFMDVDGPDNDLFTWDDNDLRLSPTSPCIDAGRPIAPIAGLLDLIGSPRFFDGNGDFVARLDMGPREYPSRCDADFDGSGFVDTDDFDAFVRAFEAGC
jgi:hypothetical protein